MGKAVTATKADVYRYFAAKYKWTFAEIAKMTLYQQAVAMGDVLKDDEAAGNIQYFDDYDAMLEAVANYGGPKV